MKDNKDELAFEVEFLNCVIDKKKDFEVIDADSHFCDFVGIHHSKIKQGKLSLLDLLVPQSRQEIMEKLCKKKSPYVYFELYIKDNSGEYNHVHCTARNNDENSLCQITFADVGKSEKKSKKIREKAKTMNHLIDRVNGGVCLFRVNQDMQFEILYANEACCRFFGTTKETINTRAYRIDDLIYPDDKSAAFQAIGKAMATKKPIDMELRIMTHRDEYIWCKMNSDIQRYDKDNCPIFHAIFTDITALKIAQTELESQKEMLFKVLKNVPGPVFCSTYEKPFELNVVSSEFLRLLGYKRAEFFESLGGDLKRIIVPEDLPKVKEYFSSVPEDQKMLNISYSIVKKDGEIMVVYDSRKVVRLDNGDWSLIGMITDKNITEYFS